MVFVVEELVFYSDVLDGFVIIGGVDYCVWREICFLVDVIFCDVVLVDVYGC